MSDDVNIDDSKFFDEMRDMQKTGKAIMELAEYEIAQLSILLQINGVENAYECYRPETDELIALAAAKARMVGSQDDGKTDFALFARYLLMAAFRAAVSTYEITRRKYDPTYEGDVEGPVGA